MENLTVTVVYTYNGDGVRVAQSVNNSTTTYIQDILGLPQVLIEIANHKSQIYIYGLGRLAQVEDDSAEWFLGDALGSVRQIVDDAGEVVLAQAYDPYGQVLTTSGTSGSGYGFTGEQQDGYTQFIYLRARWMDPEVGRFLSQDQWPGDDYNPSGLHVYVYVWNNPLRYVDPSGHDGCPPGTPCFDPGNGAGGDSYPWCEGTLAECFKQDRYVKLEHRQVIDEDEFNELLELVYEDIRDKLFTPPVVLELGWVGYIPECVKYSETTIGRN